jgi:hypothetical protein
MTTHYFPDADDPDLQPFTRAFVTMMFAHAALERRIADLLDTITGVSGFGESPEVGRWSASQRPKQIKKIIRENLPLGFPEQAIVECLKKAIPLFRGRNLLAHGTWWEFSADAITVRSGIDRPSEEQHRTFTAPEIQQIATSLDDLEVAGSARPASAGTRCCGCW